MLRLVLPTLELEEDCKEFIEDHYKNGETNISGDGGLGDFNQFSDWIVYTTKSRNNLVDLPNRVPSTTFFGYDQDKLVGIIDIRHQLNQYLINYGGHIGYGIRPSERRKGYAKQMLKLALDYCKNYLQLEEVLITCDIDNLGSIKTILANGGVLENDIYDQHIKRYTKRYWVKTSGNRRIL